MSVIFAEITGRNLLIIFLLLIQELGSLPMMIKLLRNLLKYSIQISNHSAFRHEVSNLSRLAKHTLPSKI